MIDDFKKGSRPTGRKQPPIEDFLPDLSFRPAPTVIKPFTFQTPEEIAATEAVEPAAPPLPSDNTTPLLNPVEKSVGILPAKTPRNSRFFWKHLTHWFSQLRPWQKILCVLFTIAVVLGVSIGAYALFGNSEKPVPAPKKVVPTVQKPVEPPKPTTIASTLTGRQVAPEINSRQVTAVMIENSSDARPQGGLQQAGVVFEAIAEGGITRFIALFQDTDTESIGPVRSVRPYYISWAQGFDAAIAHVGGSPEALQIIRDRGLKDMDQSYNSKFFQRVTFRYAPHNVFTSTAQLRQLQDSKGYTNSNYTGFARTATKGTPANPVTAGKISVNISSANYASSYTYDPATNTYARSLAGAPHTDITTKTQITPDVVVAMVVNYSIHADGIHSVYDTLGGGQVYVFQNGSVTTGTWAKPDHTAQITFSDSSGKPILLNPGQTWITAVNSAGKVTYTP